MDKDNSTIHDDDDTMSLKTKSDTSYTLVKTDGTVNGPIRFSVNFKDKKPSTTDLQVFDNYFSWMNLFQMWPTILATIVYRITLIGCYDSQFVCLEKYPLGILKYLVILIAISGFFFFLQFLFFLQKKNNTKQILTTAAVILFLCFVYDTGVDLKSHGSYNRIVLFFFLIFFFILYLLYFSLVRVIRKHPIPFIIIVVLLVALINYKIKKLFENSCYNWSQGFNDTVIDNSFGNCKIYAPKTCYYEIFHGTFDFSRIFGETCENTPNNNPRNTLDFIPDKNAKFIGFPRTENFNFFPESKYKIIQQTVASKIINMEDPKISDDVKKNIEVTINYHKSPPEVKIDLKVNQTLINERAKLFEPNKDKVLAKNVFYLFIDSLSRTNFRRKLPKLYSWVEARHFKRTTKSAKTESFQFLKYHGVGRFTGINMVPAFLGVFNIYYNGYHFIRDYKNRGYITGQSLTFCGREVFDLDGGAIEKMKWDTHDHEMISLFCDGNFTPLTGSTYPILTGTNAIRKRCLYGQSALSYSLNYANQFFDKYKDQPKFFKLGLTEAHEGSNEVIKYSDDELVNFLMGFEKKGYLDNTVVYFMSDHGLAMLGPYSAFELEDYSHEAVLPSFFMLVPKSLKNYEKIRPNLMHNENSIVTPFNIYNSLKSILNDRRNVRYSMLDDKDIFNKSIPREYNCKQSFYLADYYDDIEFICRCNDK